MRFLPAVLLAAAVLSGCQHTRGQLGTGSEIYAIDVTAWQWGYEPNLITVTAGSTVRMTLTSLDVEHSITCDELGLDETIPSKGKKARKVEFTVPRSGDYNLLCARPCGPAQSRMYIRVRAVPASR